MHLAETALRLVQSLIAATSISLNSLLLFCMFRNTPASFANFGIMMKAHVIFDLCMATGGVMSMTRSIPIDWSVVNIYYGPCSLASPLVCYFCYILLVTGSFYTFYIILGSFYFRFLVIKSSIPSLKHTMLILMCISFPIPTALTIGMAISLTSQDVAEAKVYSLYPSYANERLTISATTDLRSPVMIVNFILVGIVTMPVYCATLILMRKILRIIEETASSMSRRSLRLQRNFVHMLAAQASLPLLQLIGAAAFLPGLLGNINHPLLEFTTCLVAETTASFSPFIVLTFVDHFRLEVLGLFGFKSDVFKVRSSTVSLSALTA